MTLDDRLDDLAAEVDELAQMIRNRNRDDMAPGSETWELLRRALLHVAGDIWHALSSMVGEECRWPLRN